VKGDGKFWLPRLQYEILNESSRIWSRTVNCVYLFKRAKMGARIYFHSPHIYVCSVRT
jgi:hypothetical protein